MYGISEKSFQLIVSTLANIPEIEEAILFGSRAMGNFKNGSDIDLAITGKDVDFSLCAKVSAIFNQKLPIPYKVDIIATQHITSKELKRHIQRWGKSIYKK